MVFQQPLCALLVSPTIGTHEMYSLTMGGWPRVVGCKNTRNVLSFSGNAVRSLNRLNSPHSVSHLLDPPTLVCRQSVAFDLLCAVRLRFGVQPLATVRIEEVDGQIPQWFGNELQWAVLGNMSGYTMAKRPTKRGAFVCTTTSISFSSTTPLIRPLANNRGRYSFAIAKHSRFLNKENTSNGASWMISNRIQGMISPLHRPTT